MSDIEDEEVNVLVNLLVNNDSIDEVAFALALCDTKKERKEMIKFLSDMIDEDGELNSEKIMDKLEQDDKITIIRNPKNKIKDKTKEKTNKKTKDKTKEKPNKKTKEKTKENKNKTKEKIIKKEKK